MLVIVGLLLPASPIGWAQIASISLCAIALLINDKRPLAVLCAAPFAVLLACLHSTGSASTRLTTLPGGGAARLLTRLFDEQDISLAGARVLKVLWPLPDSERRDLVDEMLASYREMRSSEGRTVTPAIDTLLDRQSADAFDTVIVEPKTPPRAGVIFLHGYAGSFTLECWLVGEAARAIDAVTVCPAMDFSGRWWHLDAERIFRETLDYLHGRGIERIYLAGLSNGGVGAAALAAQFGRDLRGLILISGAPSSGNGGGLPTLVIQGEEDPNMPAENGRAFAKRVNGTYAGFEGGHFVFMMKRHETREVLARWLRAHP
jgi:hypothetical protein